MSTRRSQLTREAARLFAEKGYHGTSIGDLAKAMGVQKGSLYAHIASKQDLLYETMREGADAFHGALDAIPDELPATEKIRLALRGAPPRRRRAARRRDGLHARVALPRGRAPRRDPRRAPALRGAGARALPRGAGAAESCAPISTTATAALLTLSAANWAYTWLQPGRDTDELADRFYSVLIDGIRGYATPC